ncbi:hypothetical protein KRR26_29770 [Corallococcus sp. M34]|uniref:hypothetical protein n=1 Tax=Citreicoccus inhibens TaxID=2849499 RepID=UPI001C22E563|nr:hypothetical protein [Citreicoccus inhibens]MBU8899808.1 hypothetical protein [Citreicoccus inhibens]
MGNTAVKAKQKPLIVGPIPSPGSGNFAVAFTDRDGDGKKVTDREIAVLTVSTTPNAHYLPWANGAFTRCEISLESDSIDYFFTADLSGCSLWYKFQDKKILIRHEARTTAEAQLEHSIAGFKCVVNSSTNPDDIQLSVDPDTNVRSAQFYVVYALLDHESRQIDFRVQLVAQKKNLLTRVETYELVKLGSVVVEFPSL